jgi:hypothetical protein
MWRRKFDALSESYQEVISGDLVSQIARELHVANARIKHLEEEVEEWREECYAGLAALTELREIVPL